MSNGQTASRVARTLVITTTLLAVTLGAIFHRFTRKSSVDETHPLALTQPEAPPRTVTPEPLLHVADIVEIGAPGTEPRSITLGPTTNGLIRGRMLLDKALVANGSPVPVQEDRTFSFAFDASVVPRIVFSSPDADGTVEVDVVRDTSGPKLHLTTEHGELGTAKAPTRNPPESVKIRVDDVSSVEGVIAWVERDGLRVDLRVDHDGDHEYRASIPGIEPYEGEIQFFATGADEWGQATTESLSFAVDTKPPSLRVIWYAPAERALESGTPGQWLIKIRASEPVAETHPPSLSIDDTEATILFANVGETTVTIRVTDKAGNRSEPTSISISDDPASRDYGLLEAYWVTQASWIGSVLDATLVDGWPRVVQNRRDGMVLAFVPARSFAIPRASAPLRLERGVYLATTEVSGGQYSRFTGNGDDSDSMPVHDVTFDQAQSYARDASGRLPTVVEMLAASTWGSGPSTYPWGNEKPENEFAHEFAVVSVPGRKRAQLAPVETILRPSCYGHHHLAGNISEWCDDETGSGRVEIVNLARDLQANSGNRRVIFSKCYEDGLASCENAATLKTLEPNSKYPFLGFRYAISP